MLANLDSNETVDLSQPHLRQLFHDHTWLLVTVITLYSLLIIIGLLGNLLLLIMLLRYKENCLLFDTLFLKNMFLTIHPPHCSLQFILVVSL